MIDEDLATEKTLRERLLFRGLDSVMKGWNSDTSNLKSSILKYYPEMLYDSLSNLNTSLQTNIVQNLYRENPDALIKEEYWVNYIDRVTESFDDVSDEFIHRNGSWYVFVNRLKDFREKRDWFDILARLGRGMIESGEESESFNTVLNWMVSADKKYLKKLLYRAETKKYPRKVKKALYKRLINFGLLDLKMARRIRSDSSGALSSEVLAYLFEKRSLYTDDDFQLLVTQFVDTKHKWVARYIATNMPMHLTPFLMGIKDKMALQILEKRLEINDEEN